MARRTRSPETTGERSARADWPRSSPGERLPAAAVRVGAARLAVRPIAVRSLEALARVLLPEAPAAPGGRGRPRKPLAARVALVLGAELDLRAGRAATIADALRAALAAQNPAPPAAEPADRWLAEVRLAERNHKARAALLAALRDRRWLIDAGHMATLLEHAARVAEGKPIFVYRIEVELSPRGQHSTVDAQTGAGAPAPAPESYRSPIADRARDGFLRFHAVTLEPVPMLEFDLRLEHGDNADLADATAVPAHQIAKL
jgi:hypothetical protein